MENSRRPFDRSREPGPKKPRLIEEMVRAPNSGARPFPQRQVASGISALASTRFRTNGRDLESGDLGDRGGGGYQPQPQPFQELVAQYKAALAELTFNSKPIITNLTIIAGENRAAEKAIAATVCANILEVPSDQKLPSLYLLDSIVKNIGRDYIKYFAARLPEVFCKAYRQVDPSVHRSMRHLFGTWKGVFPPQTLQVIEKELGFTPAVNGSSASAALRSDSQSQRPPHSIHVNPKYLERQCLQQSSRARGDVDDVTGAIGDLNDDPEMPDRALGVSRPWVDPGVTVNIHLRENNPRIHREADSVPGKSIGASYGGEEYGSDHSRNSNFGIGKTVGPVTELGHDKSLYSKEGGGVAGTISGNRNGFSLRHSFSNTEASRSLILDAHHQPPPNITNMRSSVMSNSWKNSEEEEFTWDEMNSGLTGRGAPSVSNNFGKVAWTADDENEEVEDHLQIRNPFGMKVDREMPIESQTTGDKRLPAFRHHPSSSWQLQEQHSIDELNRKTGHSDGIVSTLGTLTASTNTAASRMGNRPSIPNSTKGLLGIVGQKFHSMASESSSGHLRQQSPSSPINVHHPHLMQNSAEKNHAQTPKTSQILGGLQNQYIEGSSPALPPNIQIDDLRRSQPKDLSPVSSMTSQSRHQQQLDSSHTEVSVKTENSHVFKAPIAKQTSEQSTTSHLIAAAVKTGIFSNMPLTSSFPTTCSLDTENLPSQLGVRPSRSEGHSPALSAPNDNASVLPKIPQRKAGQPQRVSTLLPLATNVSSASAQTSSTSNNSLNPIANLLSSLVAKGLISAESDLPTKVPSEMMTRLEELSDSVTTSSSFPVASASGSPAVPAPSTKDEVDDTARTPSSLAKSTDKEIRDLIGFEFKPNIIREMHPSVVSGLFDDLPHHCSICGLRLKFREQFNRHLEWHATREREQNGLIRASRWYLKSSDWIVGKVESPSRSHFTDSVDAYGKEKVRSQEDTMVLADENQCMCVLCGELFEDFYSQENDEWMFKGAVYWTNSDSNHEMGIRDVSTGGGPIVHASCLSDNSMSEVLKMEQD